MANDIIGRRTLRTKERKSYKDNLEDEIEGRRRFDVQEKLNSDKYKFKEGENHVGNMDGKGTKFQYEWGYPRISRPNLTLEFKRDTRFFDCCVLSNTQIYFHASQLLNEYPSD